MAHILVIGSGIAGLTAALRLAGRHDVTVVTKRLLGQSNTSLAQGGIAGALCADDSVEAHIADTLSAGNALCDEDAVRVLCTEGPERILELAAAGVTFDRDDDGHWVRGLEGAHSIPRILHAGGDATGRAIIEALTNALRAAVDAGTVRLLEQTMLLGLDTSDRAVTGVTVLRAGTREFLSADAVVVATGGAGRLYAHTTNPAAATGDGLAAAIRAGAAVTDMEFYQFHPTALAGPGFLISEAVRGAGAVLLDADGHRFMPDVDRRGELAPRDVVALAIHRRMARQGGGPCFLDARTVPEVAAHFPTIAGGLAEHGFDLAADLIPVTPAAHYFMGGISTDLDGRTSLGRLFAVGEVACTGVHGANRLASNSLLEGAVFGARAAAAITMDIAADSFAKSTAGTDVDAVPRRVPKAASVPDSAPASTPSESPPTTAAWSPTESTSRTELSISRAELQRLAWAHLGVERSERGLRTLLDHLDHLDHLDERDHTDCSTPNGAAHPNETASPSVVERIETANLAVIARSIARDALAREESRGAHTRTDFPDVSHRDSVPTTSLLQEAASC